MNYLNLLWFLPIIIVDIVWYLLVNNDEDFLDSWKVFNLQLFILSAIGSSVVGVVKLIISK